MTTKVNWFSNVRRMALILLGGVALAACVTTNSSALSAKADQKKALENYTQLGISYVASGNLERAQRSIDRALEINGSDPGANAAQALLYQRQGEKALAENLYKKVLSLDSNYTRGRTFYAAFLFSENRVDEACQQLETASADTRFDGRANVFVNLATCHRRRNQPDLAIDALQKALQLDMQNEQALFGMSTLMLEQGKTPEATLYYDRLLSQWKRSQRSQTAESLWLGIQLARQSGDKDRESSYGLQLKSRFPDSEQYQRYRALQKND